MIEVLFCNRLRGGLGENQEQEVESPNQRLSVIFAPLMRMHLQEQRADLRGNERAGSIRNKNEKWRRRKSQRILPRVYGTGKPEEKWCLWRGSKHLERGNIVTLSLKVSVRGAGKVIPMGKSMSYKRSG